MTWPRTGGWPSGGAHSYYWTGPYIILVAIATFKVYGYMLGGPHDTRGTIDGHTACGGTTSERRCRGRATRAAAETVRRDPGGTTSQATARERTVATQAS
jgi:hypothetical protein